MKKTIWMLVSLALYFSILFVWCALADVAVKFYSSEPESHQNRVLGIPTNAVSEVIFKAASAPPGYVLMTEDEYRSHLQLVHPTLRAWITNVYEPWALTNSQPTSQQVSNRMANIQALQSLVNQMQNAEDNWGSLTQAQIQGLVRVHNQFLLRLRPILRDLYEKQLADQ